MYMYRPHDPHRMIKRKGGRGDDPPDQNFPRTLSPEKEQDACNADENKHLF